MIRLPNGLPDRRRIFDRRLGERRVMALPVSQDRRSGTDRRRLGDRRESPTGHLRNALQVVHALAEMGADVPLEQSLQRLRLALADIERLERWGRQLGQQLRSLQVNTQLQPRPS
ncbi:MAG: hypothetical protein KatS3mg081_0200 [Gemmatimonadales bacterium]|nr:hypothetical protein HRbin33_02101 [bacterium HR33]GIW50845.1 MAG: hypothetical protein KatS3mg081_0200 [Gemmatimonadales bacterium]